MRLIHLAVLASLAIMNAACGSSFQQLPPDSPPLNKLTPEQTTLWQDMPSDADIEVQLYPDGVSYTKSAITHTGGGISGGPLRKPMTMNWRNNSATTMRASAAKDELMTCLVEKPEVCDSRIRVVIFVPNAAPDWSVDVSELPLTQLPDVLMQESSYGAILALAIKISQIQDGTYRQECSSRTDTNGGLHRDCHEMTNGSLSPEDREAMMRHITSILSVGTVADGRKYLPIQEIRRADSALSDFIAVDQGATPMTDSNDLSLLARRLLEIR